MNNTLEKKCFQPIDLKAEVFESSSYKKDPWSPRKFESLESKILGTIAQDLPMSDSAKALLDETLAQQPKSTPTLVLSNGMLTQILNLPAGVQCTENSGQTQVPPCDFDLDQDKEFFEQNPGYFLEQLSKKLEPSVITIDVTKDTQLTSPLQHHFLTSELLSRLKPLAIEKSASVFRTRFCALESIFSTISRTKASHRIFRPFSGEIPLVWK